MDMILIGHEYRYAAEQMLLTLYPEERPVYPPESGGGSRLELELRRERAYAVALCRLTLGGQTYRGEARYRPAPGEAREDGVRLEQRILKAAFYRAALRAGHPRPAWGCLTGVRPAKFFAGLVERDRLTPRQARAALVREFGLDPERAELCAEAAAAAARVKASLAPRDVCLYIGIPYCPTRCGYCSFVSVDAPQLLRTIPAYLEALSSELRALAGAVREAGLRVVSVYVGGGTPTTLSPEELRRLLGTLPELFDLSACRELTVEAGRPDTITPEKLAVLAAQGVGRVSVNPQTMSDHVLRAIGRDHTAEDVLRAMEMVRAAGPFTVNMDLIAGLPGDTPEGFARSLDAVLGLGPENLTVHTLALKKGSRFLTDRDAVLPGADAVGEMLAHAPGILRERGYTPYYLYRQKFMSGSFENVGWTLPGRESLYNIAIMEELCSILAAGAGGSTKLVAPGGTIRRMMAPKFPREYMERIGELREEKARIAAFYTENDI